MKKIILLFSIPVLGFSQSVKTSADFNLKLSDPYGVIDAHSKSYFYHDGEMISIKQAGEIFVQKFDVNTLKEKSRTVIFNKKELPTGFVHENFVQNNDIIYQFFNVWDKENETEQIFVQEFNFKDLKPKNQRIILKVGGKLSSTYGYDKIDMFKSYDNSKHLIIYRKKPLEKRDKINHDIIGMMVLDANMREVWKKEVEMPYTEKEMDNLGYTIDSKGNVLLLARVRNKTEPHLEILKYKGGESPEITEIKTGDKYFENGINLQEGKDNKIYCAGYYGKNNIAKGIYISILNSDGKLSDEKFIDIPLDIINQNRSEKEQKKKKMPEKS